MTDPSGAVHIDECAINQVPWTRDIGGVRTLLSLTAPSICTTPSTVTTRSTHVYGDAVNPRGLGARFLTSGKNQDSGTHCVKESADRATAVDSGALGWAISKMMGRDRNQERWNGFESESSVWESCGRKLGYMLCWMMVPFSGTLVGQAERGAEVVNNHDNHLLAISAQQPHHHLITAARGINFGRS